MKDTSMLVSNSHTNINSEMKLTAIINVLQDLEGIEIKNIDSFTKYFRANNLGIYLMYRQIDIIKKPIFGQRVHVTTHPYKTNAIGGYRHIYVKDDTNNDLIKSISFGAYVNLESARPMRLPKEITNSFADGEPDLSMEHLPRRIKYDKSMVREISRVKIERSYIDRYGHLNNAYYVEFAVNAIKEIDQYDRIRAEYIKPFLEDEIAVLVLNEQKHGKVVIELQDTKGNNNAIIEFSTI